MSRPGLYLCGCNPEEKHSEYKVSRTDYQGFDICPEHGMRMYGWASSLNKIHSSADLHNLNFDGPILRDDRDPVMVYLTFKSKQDDDLVASTNGHITTEPPIQ